MTTYNFESSDEGFTLTGEGSLQFTFEEWVTPTTGFGDTYTFEFDSVQGYTVIQSINAYGSLTLTNYPTTKPIRIRKMVERRLLNRIDFIDDIYGVIRFRGELRN